MDFRIDFIACCLFGVFISLVLRSRLFASWGWSVAVGAAASLLVLFRFLSLLYVAGILGALFLYLCAALYLRRQNPAVRQHLFCQLRGLVTAGLLLGVLVVPAVWYHREYISRYYLGHLTDGESKIRDQQCGVHNTADRSTSSSTPVPSHTWVV